MKIPKWLNISYQIHRIKNFFWGIKRETYKIRIGKIGSYYDCDHMLEIAFVEIAKKFLYDELGRIEDYPEAKLMIGKTSDYLIAEFENDYNSPTFYKGFRIHFVDHEVQIDICKWFLDNESLIKGDYPVSYSYEEQNKFTKELGLKMIEFVKNRGSMWT